MPPIYTDFVGNPIDKDALICYGVKSGSSAVNMVLARVVEIVPVHPEDPDDVENDKGYTDDDIKAGRHTLGYRARRIPSRFVKRTDGIVGDRVRDDSKAYILKVKRLQDGWGGWYRVDPDKIVTVHNVTNVVVVDTDLTELYPDA